jgi:hypothetical protein
MDPARRSSAARTLRAWLRRVDGPLPVAVVVCVAGLACAVFAIGVNRLIASRALVPMPPVARSQGTQSTPPASASPSATPSASPTPQQASCTGADQAGGDLHNVVVAAPAQVSLTDGVTTLDVIVPAGAVVDGHKSDINVQAGGGAGGSQPLHGTLVQSATICVQDGEQQFQVDVPSGAQVDGSASPGPNGVQAQDIHFHSD